MEVDRAQTRVIGLILGLRKTKEKIHEGILVKKIKDTGLRLHLLNAAYDQPKKNADIPVKNGA